MTFFHEIFGFARVLMLKSFKNGVILSLKIVPNSHNFKICGFDSWLKALKVKTKNPAIEGKANQELIENFKKIFDTDIEILSGQKSPLKKVFLNKTEKQVLEKLKKLKAIEL